MNKEIKKKQNCTSYLHIKRKPIFFEGVEVKNQLLPALGERRQVAVTVHVNRFTLKDLQSSGAGEISQ